MYYRKCIFQYNVAVLYDYTFFSHKQLGCLAPSLRLWPKIKQLTFSFFKVDRTRDSLWEKEVKSDLET